MSFATTYKPSRGTSYICYWQLDWSKSVATQTKLTNECCQFWPIVRVGRWVGLVTHMVVIMQRTEETQFYKTKTRPIVGNRASWNTGLLD